MSNRSVAEIRTPSEDELKRIGDLWSALKQKPLPASTEMGIELQTYLAHAVRMVGIVSGLHPVTRKPDFPGPMNSNRGRCHAPSELGSVVV